MVTFELDLRAFKRGAADADELLRRTRDESARTARDMESRGRLAAQFFSVLRNEALSLLNVFTGGMGLKRFVFDTIASTSSLSRLADNLNMSAQDLAEWQLAARNAGGSIEGITAQLKESADQVAKFRRGMATETTEAFFQFGGKVSDLRDGSTYLEARSRIVAEIYQTDRPRAALAANMMGLDAQQFNLYREGPEGMARRRQEQSGLAREQGAAAERAERLRQKYDTAMNKLASVGVDVLIALMPSLDYIVQKLTEFGDWIIANKSELNAVIIAVMDGIKTIVQGISETFAWLFPKRIRDTPDSSGGAAKPKASGAAANAVMETPKEAIRPSWTKSGAAIIGVRYDDPKLNEYAEKVNREYGLPPGLLNAIKNKGERSNSDQVSPKAAKGVMQFIPDTWKQYGKGDPQNPYDSIDAAGRYFADLMKRYGGNVDAAITEYNGGVMQARAVQRGGVPTAAETIAYLARVKAELNSASALVSVNVAQAAQPSSQSVMNSMASTTNNSVETHITGPITIMTPATDGAGVVRALTGLGRGESLVQQGNTGIQ